MLIDNLPDFLIKLTLAIILSGAIGIERSIHNKAAGFRTMMLICMASTMFVKIALTMVGAPETFGKDINIAVIIGSAITGIGFLGAGSILRASKEDKGFYIEGLTTAAMIWFVTGIGFLIGIGLYAHAAFSTLYALIVLMLFSKFERTILHIVRSKKQK